MSKKNDMLGAITRAMVGVPVQFLGVILDICNKLAGTNGKLWYEKIRITLREGVAVPKGVAQKANPFLCLIPGAEALVLPACCGNLATVQARDLFPKINPNISWELDVATPATYVQVHEQVQDGTFQEMFTSLSNDLDKLVMSQHQIVVFCQDHAKWLRQGGWATFFLFKKDKKFFVAGINGNFGSLNIQVDSFESGHVWDAENRYRLVTQRLTP